MAGRFAATTVVDKPIEDVFAFLANGENDPKFSPRVQEIARVGEGEIGAGTRFKSTVKDAGMTTQREFELVEFVQPTKIRWEERSKNQVTARVGGYDLESVGGGAQTQVTIFNELEGHGAGKLLVGIALRQARKGSADFAAAIKRAVEAA
jgi:uncharacterized protein YndB with AHSA1/START domain